MKLLLVAEHKMISRSFTSVILLDTTGFAYRGKRGRSDMRLLRDYSILLSLTSMQLIRTSTVTVLVMEDILEACQGTIVGAWVGDATGGVLEFSGVPTPKAVEAALKMPGGGVHHLGRGQITDDGELTCALLRGLLAGGGPLNLNKLARHYGSWIESRPFDLGGTLRKSMPKASVAIHTAEMCRRGAKTAGNSQSNGCLMKISPLAVYCRNLGPQDVTSAVLEEVSLTHPNATVQWACVLYVLTIVNLLNGHDRTSAYTQARDWVLTLCNVEFRDWVAAIDDQSIEVVPNRKSGWAKIALVHGFRVLLAGLSYEDAIKALVAKGGDTDTNACIAGALIGAAVKLSGIPADMVDKVLSWSPKTGGGIKRPVWLRAHDTFPLIAQLAELSPSSLVMIGTRAEYPPR
jgi:ADP-ribosylglycohydrolase